MTTPSDPDVGVQSTEQAERRARIIQVVLDLAAEGGYDAVQLREISRRADVAMRTIYKYYGSRDNLLLNAMAHWRSQATIDSVAAVEGDNVTERIVSIYRRNFDGFRRQPKLFATYVRMQPERCTTDLDWGEKTIEDAVDAELAVFDAAFADDFRMIVNSVMFTGLQLYGHDLMSVDEVWAQIERTVRRLAGSSAH